jgi:hypothetical protein
LSRGGWHFLLAPYGGEDNGGGLTQGGRGRLQRGLPAGHRRESGGGVVGRHRRVVVRGVGGGGEVRVLCGVLCVAGIRWSRCGCGEGWGWVWVWCGEGRGWLAGRSRWTVRTLAVHLLVERDMLTTNRVMYN